MNLRRLIASPEARDKAPTGHKLAQLRGNVFVQARPLFGQPMSALGQKRTFAVQQPMSAYPQ